MYNRLIDIVAATLVGPSVPFIKLPQICWPVRQPVRYCNMYAKYTTYNTTLGS